LDDADESNEESESRVTSRLRWNCRAALGTGMRRRSTYLGIAAAGEGGDDEDEDDDDSTTKGTETGTITRTKTWCVVDNDEEEDRPDDTFRMRPAKHEDAAAWDDDDGEEEDRPDNSFRMRPRNATRKTTMARRLLWNN
jgi:hypothetical protein